MIYPSMPELLKNVNSRYLLVNVIAKRARGIADEAQQEDIKLEEKPVSMAIEEIAEGKIKCHIEE